MAASKPSRDQEFPPAGVSVADTAGFVQKVVEDREVQQPRILLCRVGRSQGVYLEMGTMVLALHAGIASALICPSLQICTKTTG